MERFFIVSRRVQPVFGLLLIALFALASPVWAAEEEKADDVAPAVVPETVEDLEALEAKVAEVIKRATPATVCVQGGGGSGSGVIVSEDGYVLTAGHVAMEPGRRVVFVFPDGKRAMGRSLGINVGVDAGLMKITDEGPWPFVEMGKMKDVKPGAWVIAMGHPGGFDLERSVVARLGRVFRVRDTVIQTDCTIIGGDSGGPLFDLDGKVVGIHSRISTSLRQNYHAPISTFEQDWKRLAAGEVWNRTLARTNIRPGGPYIGVQGENGFEQGKGAKLARVYPDTPASTAGMRSGDIVVEIDGKTVASFGDLATLIGRLEPDDKVTIVVERKGEKLDLEIVIGKAKE